MAPPPPTRARQLQAGLAALLVVGVVVGVVVALTGSGRARGDGPLAARDVRPAAVPPWREHDLARAARTAGCVLRAPRSEGRGHTTDPVRYRSNPPTSGRHFPVPALDGIYPAGRAPSEERQVHALEHGRVIVQYRPGSQPAVVRRLETVVAERLDGVSGYKTLLVENGTRMPYAVAATAWGHLLGCPAWSSRTLDAIRDFRVRWVDRGPETFPPTS